jgi:hypothetical protein
MLFKTSVKVKGVQRDGTIMLHIPSELDELASSLTSLGLSSLIREALANRIENLMKTLLKTSLNDEQLWTNTEITEFIRLNFNLITENKFTDPVKELLSMMKKMPDSDLREAKRTILDEKADGSDL